MKVKELIKKLSELDSEKEVVVLYSGDTPLNNGSGIAEVFEIKGSTNDDYVFIQES